MVPCWGYGISSYSSKVSKYSVPSLPAERLSWGLSMMVSSSVFLGVRVIRVIRCERDEAVSSLQLLHHQAL